MSEFTDYFEKKIRQTIRKHKLFTHKDKIGVAVSGGKDSITALYVLKKLGYSVEALLIDVSIKEYSDNNLEKVKELCLRDEIPLHVLSFKEKFGKTLRSMRKILKDKGYNYSYCMLCGILKRYLMNQFARGNFEVLVTGHNLDDEAQAFIMNVFRNDFLLAARQGPEPGIIKQDGFVRRVKPLFYMQESETEKYSKIKKLPVNYSICPLSKGAFRRDFKEMLDGFEKNYPSVKYNIVRFQERMKEHTVLPKYEIGSCEICGEPASKKICKTCQILQEIEK